MMILGTLGAINVCTYRHTQLSKGAIKLDVRSTVKFVDAD